MFPLFTSLIYLPLKEMAWRILHVHARRAISSWKRKGEKTRLFLSAAAEILSLHCRALSSITNLSRGLDGHRGALLALLALYASFFYALPCKLTQMREQLRVGGGDEGVVGGKNKTKKKAEVDAWDKKRVILCVFAGDKEKRNGYEPAIGGERNARPWHKRMGWMVEYVHIAAANQAHSHYRVMETF